MSEILDLVKTQRIQQFDTQEIVIEQSGTTGLLYVLIEGEVEVLRDETRVAKASEPGAVFGEMAALLGGPHTATVRALRPTTFALIENPRDFLRSSPAASLHVAELLARRLDRLNQYLIDVKRQYEGHDHLGMVDDVLSTLMNRQPRPAR